MVTGPDGKEVRSGYFLAALHSAPNELKQDLLKLMSESEILSFGLQGDECCQFDCTEGSLWAVWNLGVDGWNASELV